MGKKAYIATKIDDYGEIEQKCSSCKKEVPDAKVGENCPHCGANFVKTEFVD